MFFTENIDLIVNDQWEDLPVFSRQDYIDFQSDLGKKAGWIADDTTIVPVAVSTSKKFRQLQLLYVPTSPFNRLDAKQEKTFLEKAIDFIKEQNLADRIVHGPTHAIFHGVPEKAVSAPFGTYFLDLTQSEEDLFAGLHSKHRNVVRNAEKKGVKLKFGFDQFPVFYKLYKETMERSSMYCEPEKFFMSYINRQDENVLCGTAWNGHEPLGAILMPFSKFGAFYVYGASAARIPINGAINYLHWEAMKNFKEKGAQRYDFVGARLSDVAGTKLEGIQKFKARFGASLEEGFIWKMDINPLACKVYDGLVAAKLKLKGLSPPKDLVDQEKR